MASELEKREARARFILGLILSDVCGPESATVVYRQALAYDRTMVAARIQMGISHAYAENYAEVVAAFREAIRLNPQAARRAVREEPEEVALIGRILFPPEQPHTTGTSMSAMPLEFKEAGKLIRAATEHLACGRDEEAIEVLERSLRIDPISPYAIALLALAYLLLKEQTGTVPAGVRKSLLRNIDPLFKALSEAYRE